MSLVGIWPLYRITCGSRVALVRPCTRWKVEPITWAIACTIPRNAFPKAMPAMVPALCIFSRASLVAGSAGSPFTDWARLSKISRIACRAMPSVKSLA